MQYANYLYLKMTSISNTTSFHVNLTFLDLLDGRQRGPVGAHRHAHIGDLGRGEHGGRPVGGVCEERAAEALSSTLPPITVDGCLELVGVAQTPLITFIRVQVLHISDRDTVYLCLVSSFLK